MNFSNSGFHLLGIAGWSGAGKTSMIEAVLPHLIAHGLSVSTIKHAHKGFDLDHPGKDSFRHRAAGAREVLLLGDRRFALLHECNGEQPDLMSLLGRMAPVDLVLVEGFRDYPMPKLEIFRPSVGKPPLWPTHPSVLAVATDAAPLDDCALPQLDLNQPTHIAAWIIAHSVKQG